MEIKTVIGRKVWIGRVLSALAALVFLIGPLAAFSGSTQVVENWEHIGWPISMFIPIACLELF